MSLIIKKLAGYSIVRFGAVGFISTLMDLIVYNVLLRMSVIIYVAAACGFVVGSANGYMMNSRLTFKTARSYWGYIKYLIVVGFGLLWTELIIHYLHVVTKYTGPNQAKLVAVVLVFFWNFFLSRKWAFNNA